MKLVQEKAIDDCLLAIIDTGEIFAPGSASGYVSGIRDALFLLGIMGTDELNARLEKLKSQTNET